MKVRVTLRDNKELIFFVKDTRENFFKEILQREQINFLKINDCFIPTNNILYVRCEK